MWSSAQEPVQIIPFVGPYKDFPPTKRECSKLGKVEAYKAHPTRFTQCFWTNYYKEKVYENIEELDDRYKDLIEKCKEDIRLPGSVEDEIRKKPTGLSQFNEETLKQLAKELEGHLSIKFGDLTEYDSKDGKYLKIFLSPDLPSIGWKENWQIYYYYDLDKGMFIGKMADTATLDFF